MGYFIGTGEVPITGTGNTVSSEGAITFDCSAVSSSSSSNITPSLVISPPEAYAVAASCITTLDNTVYSTRECFATATAFVAELDLGLKVSELLYFDPAFE